MPSQEDIEQEQALMATHRRTLAHLLSQKAEFSAGNIPTHIANGIAEAQANIQRIKQVLRGWGVTVEDHPNDELGLRKIQSGAAVSIKHNPEYFSEQETMDLCHHISTTEPPKGYPPEDGYWPVLERAAIRAVTAGGMAAMGYYRQAMPWPTGLPGEDEGKVNRSTLADLEATAAILQTIDHYIEQIASDLVFPFIYLGEETKFISWFKENLYERVWRKIKPPEKFFSREGTVIRVILDGIDGTVNFTNGIPLFCSAVAIIVNNQARVSAVYDPFHHIVYSARLQGPRDNATARCAASAWYVSSGQRIDLIELTNANPQSQEQERAAIAFHLSRTYRQRAHEFLEARPRGILLERLADLAGGIYSFNTGIVAMVDVARGALGGFVNNYTNLWDIAAGEVIVRACGGIVKDFSGEPIDYSSPKKIKTSVIAAREPMFSVIHSAIKDIQKE